TKRSFAIGGFSLEVYHTFEEIVNFTKKIGNHYKIAKYVEIGKTNDGLPLIVIQINESQKNIPKKLRNVSYKPIVMIECGIHAREWISTATCLWIMNDLLKNKSPLLQKYEFHLLPVFNAEGYVYSWTRNRAWRKSRSKNGNLTSNCYGSDINRNFDVEFCQNGASKEMCDSDYCGKKAFSEKESQLLRDYVLRIKNKLSAYFSLHNFGQFWMYPYAYTDIPPKNVKTLVRMHLYLSLFRKDKSSGSSVDWVYKNTDCKIVFAVELRDKGGYGFRLPEKYIKPTATEAWAGIQAVLNNM
ncbi:carboxypeptidase B-like protein, partial [Leptotrombidium deliense]